MGRVSASVTSTPRKLEKISEVSRSAYEETPFLESIISEISEFENEAEEEINLNSSENSRHSNEDVLDHPPLDNYVARPNRITRNPNQAVHTPAKIPERPAAEEEDLQDEPRTPIRRLRDVQEKIMTPVKIFASRVKTRVENSYFVQSELLSTIFLIGIVGVPLLLATINSAGRPDNKNYLIPSNANISNMVYDEVEQTHVCIEGAVHVGHLCAPEDDEALIHEILDLSSDFDELIQNYNPCESTGNPVIRPVNNTDEFKKVVQNEYYRPRIDFEFSEGSEVILNLKDDFKVAPTLLSSAKCHFAKWVFDGSYLNLALTIIFFVAIGLAGYTGRK